ncbi:MAG: SH3 domain-containing protein [Phycisphaerae bacterium]
MRSSRISVISRVTPGFIPLLLTILLAGSAGPATSAQSTTDLVSRQQTASTRPTEAHYWLRVTGDRVNVRSRADVNSRIVGRASRDDVLEAVGSEYGWHRIVPPRGVFSLVFARYIERVGERHGIVKVDTTLRVRVGSDVQPRDPMRSEVQARLENGTEVKIIGELDGEWLKIVPPEGVYAYISGDYVERISKVVADRLRAAKPFVGSQPSAAVASRPGLAVEAKATTRPAGQPDLTGRWGKRLGWILPAIETEERKPLVKQSWDGVLSHLRPIAAQREESRVAELAAAWIEGIDRRVEEQGLARKAREIARQAERDRARHAWELGKLRQAKDLLEAQPEFDARGVLRPSFVLPAGPYGMRYKLEDPFTHKVQAYVEFPTELGIDVAACLGKYVGVRGEKQSERGVSVSMLRVTLMTVLNPDRPTTPPAREKP